MASAEQAPQGRPDNQNDPILRFHRAYAEAITDAKVMAETTSTPGWQRAYDEQQEANRKARSDAAKRLRTYAEKPGDGGIRPGIAQASDHAERDCPGWNADALTFLRAYAAAHGEFIAEAVVAAHKAAGHPEPPTTRAWGGVVQGAAHRGEIVEVGFAPRSNGSPCKVWKKNGTA